jgi:hypothetical protein
MLNNLRVLGVVMLIAPLLSSTPGKSRVQDNHRSGESSFAVLLSEGQDYISMGLAPDLGLKEFTLEAWFRMDGLGSTTGTGSHGIHLYPMISKGFGNTDAEKELDINYILGVQSPDDGPLVLVADFESTETGFRTGMNHTVYGVTPIDFGVWHHVALSYDGFEWRMYLDGILEMRTVHRVTPQYETLHHFGIGTSLDNEGNTSGQFFGAVDEVRVWNFARSAYAISESINEEISESVGLVGRWGFNEGKGEVAFDSTQSQNHGSMADTKWINGAPFSVSRAPHAPLAICPADGTRVNTGDVEITFDVEDPENNNIDITFYGREKTTRKNTYTIAAIPDTQHYVRENWWPHYFDATTQWLVDNRDAINLRYVAHVGDIVQAANEVQEWEYANISLSILDTLPDLPYGLTVGNHDEWPIQDPCCTELFNAYFPYTRYEGVVPWYGGHYGENNDSSYILFTGGMQEYIAIHTEYRNPAPEDGILDWMDGLLTKYSNRKAIVVMHEAIMPGGAGHQAAWDDQGEAVYEKLKHHSNFFLMLAGHRHGEGRRVDTYKGNTVHTIMHNFQIRPQSGQGYFRLLEFSTDDDEVIIKTYSPVLNQYETDPDSEFSIGKIRADAPWTESQSIELPSGSTFSHEWNNLEEGKTYEWKVELGDGEHVYRSEMYSFTFKITTCTADIIENGQIDTQDMLAILDKWGECEEECQFNCVSDINNDGLVGVPDLLLVVGSWGPCP